MDDFHAGIKAGQTAGLLFLSLFLLVSLGSNIFNNITSTVLGHLASRGIVPSPDDFTFVLIITFIVLSVLCAGVGRVLGLVFVKFVNPLPVPSIYFKSFGVGLVIYLLVSLPSLIRGVGFEDIYTLAAIALDSMIFSFLFIHWTKQHSDSHVPQFDKKTGVPKI